MKTGIEETMKLLADIEAEVMAEVRRAQDMWVADFDEKNTLSDWAAYINIYLGKATSIGAPHEVVVRDLRKAAGLALNALFYAENNLLAPRHFDGAPRPLSLPEIDTDVPNVVIEPAPAHMPRAPWHDPTGN
jgi:hypothetical protein